MSTNEQITALLHGELTNDRSVAELMHILSVSPEKRAIFLQHINVSRQLLRTGREITPPSSAAQGVWATIAALEPGINAPLPISIPAPIQQHVEQKSDWKRWGLLFLLMLAVSGSSYLLGTQQVNISLSEDQRRTATTPATASSPSITSTTIPHQEPLQAANGGDSKGVATRESIPSAHGIFGAKENKLQQHIAALNGQIKNQQTKNADLLAQISALRSALAEANQKGEGSSTPFTDAAITTDRLQEGEARSLPLITSAEAETQQRVPTTSAMSPEALPKPSPLSGRTAGPWRIELRQHLRSSLPGVNGLENGTGILSDREAGIAFQFTAIGRSMRLGAAIGGTTFAQVYHTNTGGALNDTIIEQAPQLTYGRMYIAPSIFEGEKMLGSLELGAGATELGPIGTAGLNLEYEIAERLTLQGGVSSWLLWTSFRNQVHTSTNLNAHIGVSLNP